MKQVLAEIEKWKVEGEPKQEVKDLSYLQQFEKTRSQNWILPPKSETYRTQLSPSIHETTRLAKQIILL